MRRALFCTLAVIAAIVAGCGDDDSSSTSTSASSGDQLVVSAAASLEPAFTDYAETAGIDAKQSFAGSDDLAAQIRQGVTPDVYAAANTSLPDDLYKDGLVEKPVVFATTRWCSRCRRARTSTRSTTSPATSRWRSATRACRSATTPARCSAACRRSESDAILDNVRSLEPDVAGIVGKLTQGAVDAGFVYITDVVATDGALKAIDLPKDLQPDVAYGAAVVDGAANPEGAQDVHRRPARG